LIESRDEHRVRKSWLSAFVFEDTWEKVGRWQLSLAEKFHRSHSMGLEGFGKFFDENSARGTGIHTRKWIRKRLGLISDLRV